MIRRPPRSTLSSSSAASDVYKRQVLEHADQITCLIAAEVEHPRLGVESDRHLDSRWSTGPASRRLGEWKGGRLGVVRLRAYALVNKSAAQAPSNGQPFTEPMDKPLTK